MPAKQVEQFRFNIYYILHYSICKSYHQRGKSDDKHQWRYHIWTIYSKTFWGVEDGLLNKDGIFPLPEKIIFGFSLDDNQSMQVILHISSDNMVPLHTLKPKNPRKNKNCHHHQNSLYCSQLKKKFLKGYLFINIVFSLLIQDVQKVVS